jgi:hypothetical protein|nr:MAG TPA: hypothetical protein [Caudoviricetes sp.]
MFKKSLIAIAVLLSNTVSIANELYTKMPADRAKIINDAYASVGATSLSEAEWILGLDDAGSLGKVSNSMQFLIITSNDAEENAVLARRDNDGNIIVFSKEVSDLFFNAGDTSTPVTSSLEKKILGLTGDDNKSAITNAVVTTASVNNTAVKEAPKKEVVETKPSKPATKPTKPSDTSVFEPLHLDSKSSQELVDKERERKKKARVTPGYREFPLAKPSAESQPIYSSAEDPLKELKPKVMVGEVFQVDDVRYALEQGDWNNGNLYFQVYDPYSGTKSQLTCHKGYGTTGSVFRRDGDSGDPICRHFNKDDRYYRPDFPVEYVPEPIEITRETTWYPYNLKRNGYVFYKGIRYNVEIDPSKQQWQLLTLKAFPLKGVDDPSLDHLPGSYQWIKDISISVSCTKVNGEAYYRMAGANSDNTPEPDPKQDNIFRELGFVIDYPDKDFCLQAWEAFYN